MKKSLEKEFFSRLCLGTAQFGLQYGIANSTGQPTIAAIKEIVEYASQNGVCFYDTAQSYGDSEKVLGKVFADLTTKSYLKVISKLHPDTSFVSFQNIEDSVNSSLERLNVPKLWGLMLHRTIPGESFERILGLVELLKSKGLIENFGVSVYSPSDALSFADREGIDIIQVPFNVLDRRLLDNGFFELANRKKKQVFLRSIFLQGLFLLDKKGISQAGMGWTLPYMEYLWSFVSMHKISLKQFVMQTVFQSCREAILLFGVDNIDQFKENLSLIGSNEIPNHLVEQWWKDLPAFPEKILNPSLWKK